MIHSVGATCTFCLPSFLVSIACQTCFLCSRAFLTEGLILNLCLVASVIHSLKLLSVVGAAVNPSDASLLSLYTAVDLVFAVCKRPAHRGGCYSRLKLESY